MSAASRFKPGDGDWICTDEKCKNVNFARRDKCNRCGKEKETGIEFKKAGNEIGKALSEKSKGLFAPDDWMCKACGNVNWARRATCNICNAPKVGNVEPRTGFGGGFMEREENVQYKESRKQAEEDEYDEFGRKRKKFRGTIPATGSIVREEPDTTAEQKKPEEEEEEEEEEEDDDDEEVDMSKYKLDSDEEEEDGDDEDLSKYDLVASDDEDSKPKPAASVATPATASDHNTSSASKTASVTSSSSSSSAKKNGSDRHRRGSSSSRSRSRSRDRRRRRSR